MPARHAILLSLAALLCCATLACKSTSSSSSATTPRDSGTHEATPAATAEGPLTEAQVMTLIGHVELLRDRPLSRSLLLQPITDQPLLPDTSAPLPDAARLSLRLLSTYLEGERDAPTTLVATRRERLARYNSSNHTLTYIASHEDTEALRAALVAAITEAIDVELPTTTTAHTLDAWLARRALYQGDASFMAALEVLERQTTPGQAAPLRAEALSRLPELLWLEPAALRALGEDHIGEAPLRATSSFAQREGAGFVASLIRAFGWSGLELALQQPPTTTAQIIDARRWFEASGEAQWKVASALGVLEKEQGLVPEHQDSAGAAWLTSWFAHARETARQHAKKGNISEDLQENARRLATLGDDALRVLPASWRADQWRLYRRGEQTLFVHLSQWEAPTSASFVARTSQDVLKLAHAENAAMRCEVTQEGLLVATLCADLTGLDLAALGATLARESRVSYVDAPDRMALPYAPSLAEALLLSAPQMTLDGAPLTWRDPGLSLGATLPMLEGANPMLTQSGLVRFFATPQGATLQLTAEPLNPLRPALSSSEYTSFLTEQITRSLPSSKPLMQEQVKSEYLGDVMKMSFETTHEGARHHLHLYHFPHRDYTMTLSISTTAEQSAAHAALLADVLQALRPL